MALPSTGFARQAVTAGGSLTDFSLIVDLSDMPSEWWDDVGSETDGTKGRAAKNDLTELATDWISFNPTADTGWLRVKWNGTLSAVTDNTLRIYPPVAANSSNAASATYGSDNAYDSNWLLYLELDEDVNNDVDGYVDRISNGNHGQGTSMALPKVAGKVGSAQDFDGSADFITIADSATLQIDGSNITVVMWESHDTAGFDDVFSKWDASGLQFLFLHNSGTMKFYSGSPGGANFAESAAVSTAVFRQFVGIYDGTDTSIYTNAVIGTDAATPLAPSVASPDILIGKRYTGVNFQDGQVDSVQLHDVARPAAWRSEEFSATNDNSVYWGVWVWNAAGGPATFDIILADTVNILQLASNTVVIKQLASDTVNIVQVDADTVGL